MKKKYNIVISAVFGIVILISCSTKKDTFVSRNMHALSTKYNILYNGDVALEKGVTDLKSKYNDNFWEILPVERMDVDQQNFMGEKTKNPNFDRAEEKSGKSNSKTRNEYSRQRTQPSNRRSASYVRNFKIL
ncbi:MAG: hypothetical protein V9G22_09570 [Ottowia sp.]